MNLCTVDKWSSRMNDNYAQLYCHVNTHCNWVLTKLTTLTAVMVVKFIARKECIVALTSDGNLHVYDCPCVTKIEKTTHVKPVSGCSVLAVHPTLPSVLSASNTGLIVLDWDQAWEQTQEFQTYNNPGSVAFNPGDDKCFTGGFRDDGEIKVCLAGFLLFCKQTLTLYI